ncbi:hypothetical protein [Marinifilum fragile]|uniref:hypothetical protein n=1 Tax=Marinifilum fragile TaxID=570161 RepID=UPI00155DAB1E|nr:hypothetical protein [Marinifilum fragile]
MSKVNKQWVEITKFQKLRNFIVHQNCILQLDSKDGKIKSNQINLLNGIGNIKIDTNDGTFILLNSKPILNFLNHIDEFIHEIIMQLGENSYPDFDDIFRTREHYGDNLPF